MYRIEILPLDKQDIQQAVSWYNLKQNNLGNRFLRNLRNEVIIIAVFHTSLNPDNWNRNL